MGANAARHCRQILDNVREVVAVELMTAAQAVDLRPDGPERLGRGTRLVHEHVRRRVGRYTHDRPLSPDIQALSRLIHAGELREALEPMLGKDE
jgi:histidine ammonia-lyase